MAQYPRGPLAISDDQVRAETGRRSADWTVLLDAWGAPRQSHNAIVDHLREIYGLDDVWANTLAIRYEHERGLQHTMSVPGDLIAAMLLKPAIRTRFEALSGADQRALIGWIEAAQDSSTRRARIQDTIAQLQDEDG